MKLYTVDLNDDGIFEIIEHEINSPIFHDRREALEYLEYSQNKKKFQKRK